MYFPVQCWLFLGPMSWTLARYCKVTVHKRSRCRGRVFGYLHNIGTELYELWQSYIISVHIVLAECLRNWAKIV